jgi:predicted PurR-regulated permease PerM
MDDGALPTPPGDIPPATPSATPERVTRLELPPRTIAQAILILAAAPIALWLLTQVSPILLDLLIALLLTAALDPAVTRLERRGLPRAASVALTLAVLLGGLILLLVVGLPPLVEQSARFAQEAPGYLQRAQGWLAAYPALQQQLHGATAAGSTSPATFLAGAVGAGRWLVDGTTATVIIVVMTAYLLIDGERSYDWVMHFMPPAQRAQVRPLLPEISRVVGGYLLGQLITSLLFGAFAFAVAVAVGVPQPLLMAAVAAVADAIPLLGVFIATVPPVLLAWTQSPLTALIVLALYVAYHQLESHLLVPRIYGRTLGISPFATLIAALVGWRLLGVVGIVLALPLAAIVPLVEQVWRHDPA